MTSISLRLGRQRWRFNSIQGRDSNVNDEFQVIAIHMRLRIKTLVITPHHIVTLSVSIRKHNIVSPSFRRLFASGQVPTWI